MGLLFLKVVIGEIVIEDEFGGVEMYVFVLGLVEFLVDDDSEGVMFVWEVVECLDWNFRCVIWIK